MIPENLIKISCICALLFFSVAAAAQPEDDTERLVRHYEEEFARNPFDAHIKNQLSVVCHNRAIELAQEGLWPEAIEKEERAYELDVREEVVKNTLAYLYNGYGLELQDKGQYDKAVDSLKRALEYAPQESQLRKNLAVVYLSMANNMLAKKEYDNTERMLLQAQQYDAENPYLYVLRGNVAEARDNYFQTRDNWTKALELNPGLYDIRLKLEKMEKEKELERNFKIKEIENFKLKFEGIEKQELADIAGEILRDAYREVGRDFNYYPRGIIPVVIYPEAKLKKLDYFPDWAAGTYDGKIRFGEGIGERTWFLKAVLYHEYTHVVVHELARGKAPLWLNEGLAEYEASKHKKADVNKERRHMLAKAVRNGTIFSIDQLTMMDLTKLSYLSPHRIELVYAQAESFIEYMINRASLYDINNLLLHLVKGSSIYKAVKDVLFVDLEVLERDWKNEFQ